jgi:DNA-binding transcriptional LysR family regulator
MPADVTAGYCRTQGNKAQFGFCQFKHSKKFILRELVLETTYIESFIAVAECGSVAEAARRLNITATALAQRIQVLEQDLAIKLVARSGRTVRLTEGGTRFLSRARQFQREVRELRAAPFGDESLGRLRLGAISTALTGLLPPMLVALVERYPKMDIYIAAGVSRDLYHQVLSGKVDAALIVEPPFPVPKSLTWRVLREEPLVVLAPIAFARADPVELLSDMPLIRYDRHNWGGSLADQYLQKNSIRPRERFELDALDGILALVGLGLGVSVVPDWTGEKPLPADVVMLPLPGDVPVRRLGMLWPAQSAHGRVLDGLISLTSGTGNGSGNDNANPRSLITDHPNRCNSNTSA